MTYYNKMPLVLLLCLACAGCKGRARGAETVVSITSASGVLASELFPARACLWISGLTTPSTVVAMVLAHDAATLEQCMRFAPPITMSPLQAPPQTP